MRPSRQAAIASWVPAIERIRHEGPQQSARAIKRPQRDLGSLHSPWCTRIEKGSETFFALGGSFGQHQNCATDRLTWRWNRKPSAHPQIKCSLKHKVAQSTKHKMSVLCGAIFLLSSTTRHLRQIEYEHFSHATLVFVTGTCEPASGASLIESRTQSSLRTTSTALVLQSRRIQGVADESWIFQNQKGLRSTDSDVLQT